MQDPAPSQPPRLQGPSQQPKPVLLYLQKPLPLHFAELIGQGTAVYSQIIRQLLAVKRNREPCLLALGCPIGQKGQQSSPDRLGRRMKDPPGQVQVLPGGNPQQVFDQTRMIPASIRTGMQYPLNFQKQNLCRPVPESIPV